MWVPVDVAIDVATVAAGSRAQPPQRAVLRKMKAYWHRLARWMATS
jgi:hypothetical protein